MIIKATTTVSVIRAEDSLGTDVVDRLADSYDPDGSITSTTQPPRFVARRVRANIGSPSGTEQIIGGNQEVVTYRMQCDPVDLYPTDKIQDDATGLVYDVVAAVARRAFKGREYTQVTLSRSRGAA